MFKKTYTLSLVITLIVAAFASDGMFAQDTAPAKEKKGFGGVLQGEKDPSKVRRSDTKKKTQPANPQVKPQRSFKDRAAELKDRITELKKQGYADLDLINSPKEAAQKIEELKKRRKKLDAKFEGEVADITKDTVKSSSQFDKKWSEITGALTDGKSKSQDEWMDLYKKSLGTSASKDADSTSSSKKSDLKFEEIRKTLDQAKKPRGVPAQIWARIQDQFFYELSRLQAKVAAAQKKVNDQKSRELSAIDRAIAAAEANLKSLVEAGKRPTDAQLRNLAWQLQRARIAQMVALYNRLMLADLEAEGLPNQIQIAIKPMSPSETLEDVARKMETSNRPVSPQRGQFDDWDGEGLPNLFPDDPDLNKLKELLDKGEFYGNVLKSRMDRNRRLLESLNKELVNLNPDSVVDAERRKEIEEDIEWLVNRNAKDSETLEKMGPDEKSKQPKKETSTEEKSDG